MLQVYDLSLFTVHVSPSWSVLHVPFPPVNVTGELEVWHINVPDVIGMLVFPAETSCLPLQGPLSYQSTVAHPVLGV